MKKIIRIIISILAIILITYSGYNLWGVYSEYALGERFYDEYASEFLIDLNKDLDPNLEEESFSVDFEGLQEKNKDVVAWLYIEDTAINYPIVQGKDNHYYLRRLLDGTYNIAGSIFMDCRNSADLNDLNTIIYGHNLNNGEMFGNLVNYARQEYYEEHPVMHLLTPEREYIVEMIAGYQTDVYSNVYQIPNTEEELMLLYDEIIELSTFKSNASLNHGDRLITLSTCSNGDYESRYVLIGKFNKT